MSTWLQNLNPYSLTAEDFALIAPEHFDDFIESSPRLSEKEKTQFRSMFTQLGKMRKPADIDSYYNKLEETLSDFIRPPHWNYSRFGADPSYYTDSILGPSANPPQPPGEDHDFTDQEWDPFANAFSDDVINSLLADPEQFKQFTIDQDIYDAFFDTQGRPFDATLDPESFRMSLFAVYDANGTIRADAITLVSANEETTKGAFRDMRFPTPEAAISNFQSTLLAYYEPTRDYYQELAFAKLRFPAPDHGGVVSIDKLAADFFALFAQEYVQRGNEAAQKALRKAFAYYCQIPDDALEIYTRKAATFSKNTWHACSTRNKSSNPTIPSP